MKYVVIVNGKPQVGKTTFQELCMDYWYKHVQSTKGGFHIISSVSKIYEIYKELGWDGEKSDQFRDDMSALKAMYIRNCDGPTRDIVKFVLGLPENMNHIIFTDCREPEEIMKLVDVFKHLGIIGITVTTLLIRRNGMDYKEYGNNSDMDVCKYESYKYTINNDDGVDGLKTKAYDFCNSIIKYPTCMKIDLPIDMSKLPGVIPMPMLRNSPNEHDT